MERRTKKAAAATPTPTASAVAIFDMCGCSDVVVDARKERGDSVAASVQDYCYRRPSDTLGFGGDRKFAALSPSHGISSAFCLPWIFFVNWKFEAELCDQRFHQKLHQKSPDGAKQQK